MNSNAARLESLWDSDHAKLLNYVRHRTDADSAEDIVQEVYLSAWEAMCRGMGYTDQARAWLYRIARNAIIDRYRARGRAPRTVELDAPLGDMVLSAEPLPHKLVEQAETTQAVQAALDRLPDNQAIVIRKRMEGDSFEEIARATGRKYDAVKQLSTRGYAGLRAHLAEYGSERQLARHDRRPSFPAGLRAALLENGPMTARELADVSGLRQQSVSTAISRCRDVVVSVGTQPIPGNPRYVVTVWGLAGVHDQEAA